MSWREIPKIDAHIHIVPDEVHKANPTSDDEFSYASAARFKALMDEYNIASAVIMPFNDPWLMSMDFTVDAVHRNLSEICKADSRFFCFADVDVRNTPKMTCDSIRKAFAGGSFRGIKLHPNNSGMDIDDEYNDAIAECALELDCPIAVHSYPSSEGDRQDSCSPARIQRWMKRHPGSKVIVCHLGGFQWEDAIKLDAFFDISAILPDHAARYGLQKTNEILRQIGIDRLLFGTDWPCSRSVEPSAVMERYMTILDRMDFGLEEMHRIAHKNAEAFLGIPAVPQVPAGGLDD